MAESIIPNTLNEQIGNKQNKTWNYLGWQGQLNGGDAIAYPDTATELYLENGGTYAQWVHIIIAGNATYYYNGDYSGNGIAVQINRTNRKAWVYAGKQSGSAISSADTRVYWR